MKEVENCSKILGFARSLTYQNYLVGLHFSSFDLLYRLFVSKLDDLIGQEVQCQMKAAVATNFAPFLST